MRTFLSTDRVKLRYTDAGGGKPVVLIAGYTASSQYWALTEDALLQAGYRVICFDRRSHGQSDSPMHGQRIARHGKDIAELMAELNLTNAALVGASMGASCIWAYVDLFGSEQLNGIVSVDQTPKMINTNEWTNGFYGLTEKNVGVFFEHGIPETGRGQSTEEMLVGIERLVSRLGGLPEQRDPRAPETVRLLQDHANQDWRDVIERVEVPFLMVAGGNSQLWSSDHATAAAASNPNGQAIAFENAGHATNLDCPDEFNDTLLTFLTESADRRV